MIAKLDSVWWTLRVGLGLGAFLAGLDKFSNLLADWEMYLSPLAGPLLPMSGSTFMRAVGVIEMAVGAAVLAGLTRIGVYVLTAWLVGIAVNLVSTGMFFDVAVRDVEIAIAAFTLAPDGGPRGCRHGDVRRQLVLPSGTSRLYVGAPLRPRQTAALHIERANGRRESVPPVPPYVLEQLLAQPGETRP
jgi:hypothetical protein